MSDRWLFVSDVDDTLLGDDTALSRLMAAFAAAPNQVITAYNSSRPCASLRRSLAAVSPLKTPDYLIGGLGTEIQHGNSGHPLTGYTEFLGQNWQRERIAALMDELNLVAHADEYQTPFKASFDAPGPEIINTVRQTLANAGLAAKIIFSGGKNLDLIPEQAGKGGVIEYLRQQLAIPPTRVIVSGDSGNDIEMFNPPHGVTYKGVIVGNADPDLKQLKGEHIYHAQASYAAGIIEGLQYWQVL